MCDFVETKRAKCCFESNVLMAEEDQLNWICARIRDQVDCRKLPKFVLLLVYFGGIYVVRNVW